MILGGCYSPALFLCPSATAKRLSLPSLPSSHREKSLLLLSVPQLLNTAPALPSPRQRLKLSGLCRASLGRGEPPGAGVNLPSPGAPFPGYQPCQLEAGPAGLSPLACAGEEVKGEGGNAPHHTEAGIPASPLLFPSFPLPRLGVIFKTVSLGGIFKAVPQKQLRYCAGTPWTRANPALLGEAARSLPTPTPGGVLGNSHKATACSLCGKWSPAQTSERARRWTFLREGTTVQARNFSL